MKNKKIKIISTLLLALTLTGCSTKQLNKVNSFMEKTYNNTSYLVRQNNIKISYDDIIKTDNYNVINNKNIYFTIKTNYPQSYVLLIKKENSKDNEYKLIRTNKEGKYDVYLNLPKNKEVKLYMTANIDYDLKNEIVYKKFSNDKQIESVGFIYNEKR